MQPIQITYLGAVLLQTTGYPTSNRWFFIKVNNFVYLSLLNSLGGFSSLLDQFFHKTHEC